MMKRGIDVSKWQGVVDWGSVKRSGKVDFVILRAGYGSNDDPQFERNYSECTRQSIPVGAYWFSYATTVEQAEVEMQCFLRALEGKRLDYPVYFDQEYVNSIEALTTNQRTAIVKAALEALEEAGYYAGLYCSRDWVNNRLRADQLTAYDLWVADYTSAEPSPTKLPYGMRQTDSGNSLDVPGFGNSLDCNTAYKDYPKIIKSAGLNGYSTSDGDAPEKIGSRFVIGPVSSGDAEKIRAMCRELDLYTQNLVMEV